MPKIKDVLSFREDHFFDGAVQSDWFYDESRRINVASHFVFHGQRYFGVTKSDVGLGSDALMDTCSFTEDLSSRLQDGSGSSQFVMAIAGYGTGKSHLVVTLASLFGGVETNLEDGILRNIEEADADVGHRIQAQVGKPNLVLVLNGMRDFNLNYGLLNAARKSLAMHGLDDTVFRSMTKPYDIARHFVQSSFDHLEGRFAKACETCFPGMSGHRLKKAIVESVGDREDIFSAINGVYEEVNGNAIRWDDGISAYDVLQVLNERLCGARKPFNKLLILFDEFGRFIEYAGAYPQRAGDAGLQQMFEAVQNSDGGILFVGFVQSDLRAYMSRVDKSSNVSRYVGRYEASDKVYLSSNLETIFAGLIERNDPEAFNRYVVERYNKDEQQLITVHSNLLDWCQESRSRGVWREFSRFRKVVAEGTYPLHPFTTWFLSNLHEWLQQRSALTFVRSAFAKIADRQLRDFGETPLIRPIELFDTGLLQELLLAEEQGRQKSRFCTQYDSILRKHIGKFNEDEQRVLAANLILRIGGFRTRDKAQVITALQYCTGIAGALISKVLETLEQDHGVISYDSRLGSYDFVEDAVGAGDFKRFITAKRRNGRADLSVILQQTEVKQILGVASAIETEFPIWHHIRTKEWQYSQDVVCIDALDDERIEFVKNDWVTATSPDVPKGQIVWAYMNSQSDPNSLQRLQDLIRDKRLQESPIIFMLVDDRDDSLADTLRDFVLLSTLSESEKVMYGRFLPSFESKTRATLSEIASRLKSERKMVTPGGVTPSLDRMTQLASARFEQVYPEALPFPFEGFHNKSGPAKKILSHLARRLCSGLIGEQWVKMDSADVRNRFTAVLFTGGGPGSWGVVSQDYKVTAPLDPDVRQAMTIIDGAIPTDGISQLKELISILTEPPYGMNDYSAALLMSCFLALNRERLRILVKGSPTRLSDWANQSFADKTVDFEVLEQTAVERRDETDRIQNFCGRVEANTEMQECGKLKDDLDLILAEEDIPEECSGRIEACRIIIEEGRSLNEKFESCISKAEQQIALASKGSEAHRALSAVKALRRQRSEKSSDRYGLNKAQINRLNDLLQRADKTLRMNWDEWLNSLSCGGPGQMARFDDWTKHVIADLQEMGYIEHGKRTQAMVTRILDNVEEIRRVGVVREEIERYDKVCRPSDFTGYAQLMEWKVQAARLTEYACMATAPGLEQNRLVGIVAARQQFVEDCLNKLVQQVGVIIEQSLSIRTIDDCETLYSAVRNLLEKSLREQEDRDLRRLANDLQDFISDIAQVQQYQTHPCRMMSEVQRLTETWESRTDDIATSAVLEQMLTDSLRKCAELEQEWASRHLQVRSSVDTWSAEECSRWLEVVSPPPPYLSQQTLARLGALEADVKARQTAIPVEAIVDAFGRLNEEQKTLCLRLIGGHNLDRG